MTDGNTSQEAQAAAPQLPTGTVTFFFTDIEGSTKLLQELGERYQQVQDDHTEIMRKAIVGGGGQEIRTEGDSFFVVFTNPSGALHAAVTAQRGLSEHPWSHGRPLRVRMGLHTGEGRLGGDDYIGIDVNRAARIAAAGHGGQVLISDSTRALVEHSLPSGVAPRDLGEHRLKDIAHPEHLYDLVIEGLPPEFPPLKSLDARPNNLPVQLTSFVGRESDISAVIDLMRAARLVTLTGPGGTGKTRLGLEVAGRALEDFPDGGFFVDLSAISDPDLVPSAIARTLDVVEDPGRPVVETLSAVLKERNLLLLLDNFEQVTPAAEAVERLLREAPSLHVVATSRVALHVAGEHEFQVRPLLAPDPDETTDAETLSQYDSVALFIERARAVRGDFAVTNDNAPAVAEVCARLDGLPLAIELAASRVKVLTPQAILGRLVHRLPVLTSASRNVPERQRTLAATIDWSFDLLEASERPLLTRLSVFAGGWTLDAAETVCNPAAELGIDTLDGLESLVDKSLVRQTESTSREPRFRMLETIREYAGDRLRSDGEEDDIARRHASFILSFAEAAEPHLLAKDQVQWLDRCDAENGNIRAALQWSIDSGEAETGLRIGALLWRFWQHRGHLREGRRWMDKLLALPRAADRTAVRASALGAAGGLAYWASDYDTTRAHYEEALSIYRELEDKPGIERALFDLSFAFLYVNDLQEQERLLEESLAIAEEIGDKEGVLNVIDALGFNLLHQRRWPEARTLIERTMALSRELGNAFHLVESTASMALVHAQLGEHDRASEYYREAIGMHRAAGTLPMATYMLIMLADTEANRGRHQRAMRLLGAGESLREKYGTSAPVATMMLGDSVGTARVAIGVQAVEQALAEGRAMDADKAIDYAVDDSE